MLVGGIVEPGAGAPGAVISYVAVSGGPAGSRLFKVSGPASAPAIEELPPATTVDLGRFDADAQRELAPALLVLSAKGGKAAITRPSAAWVCGHVKAYLKKSEDLDVD
jgi:hypothetical protein